VAGLSTFPSKYQPRPTAYFAPWWVYNSHHVCPGWEIDYSTARCPATQSSADRGNVKHWHGCFEGVIVKSLVTHEVWRLTGNIDNAGYFEGRWPD
jgi:hypothetical protein